MLPLRTTPHSTKSCTMIFHFCTVIVISFSNPSFLTTLSINFFPHSYSSSPVAPCLLIFFNFHLSILFTDINHGLF